MNGENEAVKDAAYCARWERKAVVSVCAASLDCIRNADAPRQLPGSSGPGLQVKENSHER